MRPQVLLMFFVLVTLSLGNAFAADAPQRVLLVTHAGGFMHDSLLTAEKVLKTLGPEHGLQVTCWRFTADSDAGIKVKRKQGDQDNGTRGDRAGGLQLPISEDDGRAGHSPRVRADQRRVAEEV